MCPAPHPTLSKHHNKSCFGDTAAALLTCGSQQRHMQCHLSWAVTRGAQACTGAMRSSCLRPGSISSLLPEQHQTGTPPAQCLCSPTLLALQATQELLQVASTFKHLQAFVHVSTAFVNGNLPKGSRVLEHVYPLNRKAGSQAKHAEALKQPGGSPNELAAFLARLPAETAQSQVRTAMLMPAACSICWQLLR